MESQCRVLSLLHAKFRVSPWNINEDVLSFMKCARQHVTEIVSKIIGQVEIESQELPFSFQRNVDIPFEDIAAIRQAYRVKIRFHGAEFFGDVDGVCEFVEEHGSSAKVLRC